MFEHATTEGVFQLTSDATARWLSTGWNGGFRRAAAAYNVSVPSGWTRENLDAYVEDRRERAGFEPPGPTLLTGVDLAHARGARMGPVVVYATVGLSNPAALPVTATNDTASADEASPSVAERTRDGAAEPPGTVNVLVGTTRPLTDGALATLVATAVEAKTATLLSLSGFTGTTTDAVIAGTPTRGDREPWAGSATEVGNAARVCVRDAVRASCRSRDEEQDLPECVADADHGDVADGESEVFEI